jgi:uncharacterized repeat protein (TIGR02543 family)
MKQLAIFWQTLTIALLFIVLSSSVFAVDLNVSGITTPSEANGTYTLAGTYSGYSYWSFTAGGTTYVIYNDVYSTGGSTVRYWNLDTNFDDEGTSSVLFFSSASTDNSPAGLSYSGDVGVGTLNVTTGTPTPDITVFGGVNAISDGSTIISSGNFTNIGSASISGGTATRTFTIKNTGSAALTLSGSTPYVAINGANASSFSVSAAPAQSIAASTGATNFTISFTPSAQGYHNAVVTINSNDPDDESVYTFNIQGYGFVAQSLVVSGITEPSAANGTYLHQGVINNSQYWKHQTLNYFLYFDEYSGAGYWNIDNNTIDGDNGYFYKASEDGTPLGLTSWTAGTLGSPPAPAGSPVISPAVLSPEINLKGNSTSIATNDNIPSFADQTKFGSVDVAATDVTGFRTRTYTIENTGGAALTISGITLGGTDASEFSKTNPGLTTVPAYGSTNFTVTFNPTTEGIKTATLSIANNDADENPYIFTISGDAFTPKSLIVSNITTPSAANGTYTYKGILNECQYWKHESQEYYIFNDQYLSTSYYWNIDANPTDEDNNYLFVRSSEAVSPVGLSGWSANTTAGYVSNGTPTIVYAGPEMDVRGNSILIGDGDTTPSTSDETDFGSVSVTSGTASHTFTIFNTGYDVLNLSGTPNVAVSGANAADFTVTAQPSSPVAITTGTTTFTVEFVPSAVGTRSATISIANDDSDENPYVFSIQGVGVAPTVSTVSVPASATYTAGQNLDFTVNYSEAMTVAGGTPSIPITLNTGGTVNASYVSGSGTAALLFRCTVVAGNLDADGVSVGSAITLNGATIQSGLSVNAVLTLNGVSSTTGVMVDAVVPTVSSITRNTPATSLTNASSVTFRVTFSESVTGVDISDFSLATIGTTTGTIASVSASSGTAVNVTVNSVNGDGTLRLDLNASGTGIADNAGNAIATGFTSGQTYTIDKISPTVIVSTTAGSTTNMSPIPITITFSETVTGFVVGGITVANGMAGNFSGSGTTYTADITPSGQGIVTVDVAGSVAQDAAGNNNTAATQLSRTYDTQTPTVSISTTAVNPTNTSPIPVTITFSESVTGFVVGDITVGNGMVGNFSGSGTTYTADITPSGQGTVTVDIAGSVAQDAAGNNNTVATQLSRTYDSQAPTVSISTTAGSSTNASPIPVTITFNESVTGFVVGDLTVVNGTASSFAGSGTTYTVNITPTGQGLVTVNVAASVAQDLAGNNNTVATQLSRTYDSVAPTVSISTTALNPTNTSPIPVTITFSESVTGFVGGDITVGNGMVGNFSGSGTTYTADITPSGQGIVTVDVAGSVAQDAAGNNNTAATQWSRFYDSLAPIISSVSSSTTDGIYKLGDAISIQVTFSENVTVTGTPTLALNSGGTASYVSGTGTSVLTFNYTVGSGQSSTDLDYLATTSLSLSGGTIKDAAGNDATLTLPTVGGASSLGGQSNIVIVINPTVTTQAVTSIGLGTATGNGNISDLGVPSPTAYGVCWNTAGTPTILDSKVDRGAATVTGPFIASLTGLTANTTYHVRAFATNIKGTTYGSEVIFSSVTVPDAPTSVTASPGVRQAIVNFVAPAWNGGSPISGYTVTSSPEGKTATGTTSPITIGGLSNGVTYTFTVKATNIVGNSLPSAASNSITTPMCPGEPTNVTATAGNNHQAMVFFAAPERNGGNLIYKYTVTSSPGGFIQSGASSPLTVTGLTNGIAYTFTVIATNEVGDGLPSAPSAAVTPYATATTWRGTGNWYEPDKWDNGVPAAQTAVTIDGDVTLTADASAKEIVNLQTSTATIAEGKTLKVTNTVKNYGTIVNTGAILGTVLAPVVFEENGGTEVPDLMQEFGTSFILPKPAKAGYTFVGWCTDKDLKQAYTPVAMQLNRLTLYALWQLSTGVVALEEETLKVYPNPVTDSFTVTSEEAESALIISDMNGRKVLGQQVSGVDRVDISNLAPGVYVVRVNGKSCKLIKK